MLCLEQSGRESETMKDMLAGPRHGEIPTTITITGAGTSAVNGEYHLVNRSDDDEPGCIMHGFYDGKAALFVLSISLTEWFIHVRTYNGADLKILYCNLAYPHECIHHIPPKTGWTTFPQTNISWKTLLTKDTVEGDKPCPTLTYTFASDH